MRKSATYDINKKLQVCLPRSSLPVCCSCIMSMQITENHSNHLILLLSSADHHFIEILPVINDSLIIFQSVDCRWLSNPVFQFGLMERSLLQYFIEVHSSSIIFFNVRLSQSIRKISSALHGIETSLLSPDVELDELMMERERKINLEFARRFSRNNLYSIHLKISKLENEIVAFRSRKHCKLSKAIILRALILSLVSHLSRSVQIYEKFLRKSKLKCLPKLDDLIDYLRTTFQIITYIVDTSFVETLDMSETISLILKLSRERKRRINTTDFTIRNKKQLIESKKVHSKQTQIKKQVTNKNVSLPTRLPQKRSKNSSNNVNTRRVLHLPTNSLLHRVKMCNKNSTLHENGVISEENRKNFCPLKLQRIYFELCNDVMQQLIVEASSDITECISNLIIDAYKHELVNNSLR